MSNAQVIPFDERQILKGAVLSGVINAVINGAIQWYLLSDFTTLPLSVDGITNDEHTVFGAAVPLAVSLAMILTAVAYTTVKHPKPPFYPTFLWMVVKHGFFALGLCITFAVLWQRVMGSIMVSTSTAVILLGLLAGIVSMIVNYMTINAAALSMRSGPA